VTPLSPKPLPRHHREIAFKNVTFGYDDEHPVIENIDLRVKFGETIAIVGPTAAARAR
jgi:ABC-type multidrug transport system, ATPase and permease components